jgi:lysozyme
MKASDTAYALIKAFEGFSSVVYHCPAGLRTIGYGHVVQPEEDFPVAGITETEAERLLALDVIEVERCSMSRIKSTVTQYQWDATVSFVYNIGDSAFRRSSFLRFLNAGDMEGAAAQIGRWVYVGGNQMRGLVRRRAAEQQLFATGKIL